MTLWFVLALMTAAAIFAVLWPLARRRSALRSGSDVAVYRDQLDEIERDQAAGRIGESEAAAARRSRSRAGCSPRPMPRRRRRAAPAAATAAAPTRDRGRGAGAAAARCALRSISRSARRTLPGQPLASRQTGGAAVDRAAMVAQVEAHLAKNPNEGRGWEVIAPIYLRLGRFDDAVKARRNALALTWRQRRAPCRPRRGADRGGERRGDGGGARRRSRPRSRSMPSTSRRASSSGLPPSRTAAPTTPSRSGARCWRRRRRMRPGREFIRGELIASAGRSPVTGGPERGADRRGRRPAVRSSAWP